MGLVIAILLTALASATPDAAPRDAHHRFVGFDENDRAMVILVDVQWQLDHELATGDVAPNGPVAKTSTRCLIVDPVDGATPPLDDAACRKAAPRFDRGRTGNGELATIGVTAVDEPVWMRVKDGRALAYRPPGDTSEAGRLVKAEVVGIQREAQLLRIPMEVPDVFGNPGSKDVWAILHPDLPSGDASTCLSVRSGTRDGTVAPTRLAAIQEAVGARWLVQGGPAVRNTRTAPELLYRATSLRPYAEQTRDQLEPMVVVDALRPFPEADCPLTLILP